MVDQEMKITFVVSVDKEWKKKCKKIKKNCTKCVESWLIESGSRVFVFSSVQQAVRPISLTAQPNADSICRKKKNSDNTMSTLQDTAKGMGWQMFADVPYRRSSAWCVSAVRHPKLLMKATFASYCASETHKLCSASEKLRIRHKKGP